ncbi:MAG: double-strand break repair protein AddB [Rhodospirillales bacterium]|nr:MAG: double-strand break repair protein AddB [Rhodospirillales bacterium]
MAPGRPTLNPPPRIFSIAAGAPFVDALASGILEQVGADPLRLPAVRVLLPTRRGCRALAEAFLRLSDGRPTLLPRISPLGDVDEDDLFADTLDTVAGMTDEFAIPPSIPPLRRQLLLTRLILASGRFASRPDTAARLAAELARLLEQVNTEGLSFARLKDLVPDRFAEHWQLTLDFLTLLTQHWPRILHEEEAIDPAERRARLLQAQARAWQSAPPATPVIAAGSTGSIPATAALLHAVSRLPLGAVVLPGLDRDMDEATWQALEPSHPQYGMARLLEQLGVARDTVMDWPAAAGPAPQHRRLRIIAEALRPATAPNPDPAPRRPLEGLAAMTRIDAPTPEEEARAIALIMRATLEQREKTAALVTPDRTLARRVAAELERWAIGVDDSGGIPLSHTRPGAFMRLVAEMVAYALAPIPLLATLKHPLAAGGAAPADFRARVRRLERWLLRGPRPRPGTEGLAIAIRAAQRAFVDREQPAPSTLAELPSFVQELAAIIAPLADAMADPGPSLRTLVSAHTLVAEALAATDRATGADRLWQGEAGEALARFIAELTETADLIPALDPATYPALLDALLSARVVRPNYGRHPRLFIWGPLEARLQRADVMILGSLNEGTWPRVVDTGPWMSRPMMRDFGLPPPERRIGLSAHDFTQACGAPEVFLTRARRSEGAPTVPSRWLVRIENLMGETAAAAWRESGMAWLHWQDRLDAAPSLERRGAPEPRPPVAARPRQLSVTRIETWMRDPYAIYARHILGLKQLDPLDADPGAPEYGSFVHRALDIFVKEGVDARSVDALDRLLAAGRRVLGDDLDRPGVRAFWWPRFRRIAEWFVACERERRRDLDASISEVSGRLTFAAPAGPFRLTATADRIDRLLDGSLVILDYKTGALPTRKEVDAGFAPQLPLEAAIALNGGFDGVTPTGIAALEYWRLTGGEPPGIAKNLSDAPDEHASAALDGLKSLVARFDLPETPYHARPRPSQAPRFSEYEHLARVKEWADAVSAAED